MKIRKLLFLTLIVPFTLGGCAERLEVRDRVFVQSAGIEYDNGGYTVCLRLFDRDETFLGRGRTFKEAVDDAEKMQGKDFFTGHTEAVIVRENGGKYVLESLVNEDISAGCLVLYDDDPVLFAEKNNVSEILGMISTAVRNKKAERVNICDVINEV